MARTCSVLVLSDWAGAAGVHPQGRVRQAMLDQGKSLIRIDITTWGPIATGGFPARPADQ
jgi:hypothetical protein